MNRTRTQIMAATQEINVLKRDWLKFSRTLAKAVLCGDNEREGIQDGCTNFPDIWKPSQNPWRQKGDKKQVSY